MAILESKVDNINRDNEKQFKSLESINDKLDKFISCTRAALNDKVSVTEFNLFRKTINTKVIGALAFIIITLLGIVGYLLTNYALV